MKRPEFLILVGDNYLPWGDLPEDEPEQKPIGIWGQLHLRVHKAMQEGVYTQLLILEKLNGCLAYIDQQVEEMFSRLAKQLAERQGVTEQLKAT